MDRLVLSDAAWEGMAPLIIGRPDQKGSTGRDNRMFVEGVLWIVRTGSPWRDLPEAFGDWNSVFRRFSRWSAKGVRWRIFDGAVLNSMALKIFNITAGTPTPEGGSSRAKRDPTGRPAYCRPTDGNGVHADFRPGSVAERDEMLDLLEPAQQIYASKGVNTAQEGATHAEELEFLRKAGATGRLYIDIVSLPFVAEVPKIFRSYLSTDNAKKIVVLGDPSVEFNVYNDRLKLRGIKLVADGSPEGKTEFWTKPLLTGGPIR
jgi:putative transposase